MDLNPKPKPLIQHPQSDYSFETPNKLILDKPPRPEERADHGAAMAFAHISEGPTCLFR